MEIEASYTLFRLNNNLGIRGEKMKTIIGIFSDRIDVEDAIEELRDSGFDAKDVSIVMQDKKESAAIANDTGANVAGGAVSGATTGAVLGGLAGLVSAIALPGLGAFFIGGPIAAALGLTGAAAATVSGVTTGAVAGGLVGALIGMGLPQDEAEYYEGRVREGAILVAIPATSTAQQDEIVRILDGFDAEDVKIIGQEAKYDDTMDDVREEDDIVTTDRSFTEESGRPYATLGVKGGRRSIHRKRS